MPQAGSRAGGEPKESTMWSGKIRKQKAVPEKGKEAFLEEGPSFWLLQKAETKPAALESFPGENRGNFSMAAWGRKGGVREAGAVARDWTVQGLERLESLELSLVSRK